MTPVTLYPASTNGAGPHRWAVRIETQLATGKAEKTLTGENDPTRDYQLELMAIKAGLGILKAACVVTVASYNETAIRLLDELVVPGTPALALAVAEIRELVRMGGHRLRLLKLYADGLPASGRPGGREREAVEEAANVNEHFVSQ